MAVEVYAETAWRNTAFPRYAGGLDAGGTDTAECEAAVVCKVPFDHMAVICHVLAHRRHHHTITERELTKRHGLKQRRDRCVRIRHVAPESKAGSGSSRVAQLRRKRGGELVDFDH